MNFGKKSAVKGGIGQAEVIVEPLLADVLRAWTGTGRDYLNYNNGKFASMDFRKYSTQTSCGIQPFRGLTIMMATIVLNLETAVDNCVCIL